MAAAASQAEVPHRGLITLSIMLATVMQVLDTTIANVALPSMTGDLGASQDTITWVLTSYIVAAAIMTPVTGWLSDRFGRKELFLISVVGFVVASMACGIAWSLESMVAVPAAAGRVRRGDRAPVADLPARHQSEGAPRPGDGHLGRRHHGRPDHRADAGRLADRQLQLALGVLHQPAGRHRRLPRHGRLSAEHRQTRPRFRLLRLRHAVARRRRAAADARPRRRRRLVLRRRDMDRAWPRHHRLLGVHRPSR